MALLGILVSYIIVLEGCRAYEGQRRERGERRKNKKISQVSVTRAFRPIMGVASHEIAGIERGVDLARATPKWCYFSLRHKTFYSSFYKLSRVYQRAIRCTKQNQRARTAIRLAATSLATDGSM